VSEQELVADEDIFRFYRGKEKMMGAMMLMAMLWRKEALTYSCIPVMLLT